MPSGYDLPHLRSSFISSEGMGRTVQTEKKFHWSSSFVKNRTPDQPHSITFQVLSGYFTKEMWMIRRFAEDIPAPEKKGAGFCSCESGSRLHLLKKESPSRFIFAIKCSNSQYIAVTNLLFFPLKLVVQ